MSNDVMLLLTLLFMLLCVAAGTALGTALIWLGQGWVEHE
jgi:hypothetical protein